MADQFHTRSQFHTRPLGLDELLGQAKRGELQLPDFQRDWVWEDERITSLLVSVSLSHPIGSLMTLQTGSDEIRFASRPLEGVDATRAERNPSVLLLDGQQRLTSLLLALGSRPVKTRNSRGNAYECHYYVDIGKAIDPAVDRDEGVVFSVPKGCVVRTAFGREITLDLSSVDKEIHSDMFPMRLVLDSLGANAWQAKYLDAARTNDMFSDALEKWQSFTLNFLAHFDKYQIPTIELAKETSKDAICKVFEKVNTRGVVLTVFELLTATYSADSYDLRKDWRERSDQFKQYKQFCKHGSNECKIEPYEYLQVVSLLHTYKRRQAHLGIGKGADRTPPVTCKRRDILRLPLSEFERWKAVAMDGLRAAAGFLADECVFTSRDVPYATQIVPLAAVLGLLKDKGDSPSARKKLRRWYWCGVLGELYGGSTDTRMANDVQECMAWIEEDAGVPGTVQDAQFQASRLLGLRTRNSAAYKGLYALQLKQGCRDLRTSVKIDVKAYSDDNIDIHHIFPKSWCEKNDVDVDYGNCFVNKTAISARTNRELRGRAPSAYLRWLEDEHGSDFGVDDLLSTHGIDSTALRQDDFRQFFNQRFEWLLKLIEEAMNKPVNRSSDEDRSPFATVSGNEADDIQELMVRGETNRVEFKETGRKNVHSGRSDSKIEWSVVKTICAFANAAGGTLLVGVDDSGRPTGIEADYDFVKSKNQDGWHRWLMDLIRHRIDPKTAAEVKIKFQTVGDNTVARIDVPKGTRPTFARPFSGPSSQVFFARMGPATHTLEGADMLEYQEGKWPSKR